MKLYIKQRLFSIGDKFYVYDENGEERFYVEEELFNFGKKLFIYSLGGEELAVIEKKLFSFWPRFYIYKGDEQIAEVVKEFQFFTPAYYTVNGPEWSVEGEFFIHDYTVSDKLGDTVASVSKEWFTLGDAYEIDVRDDADLITALSVVIVIDACIDASRN